MSRPQNEPKNPLPAIVVVAYNRAHSLKRILGSLNQAHYPEEARVPLVISIDRGDNQDVLAIAEAYDWRFGEKQVIYQPQNLGLKAHILACGNLAQEYGSVVLLEDDLYVSPYFYQFSQESLAYYGHDPLIRGISLYNHRANVHADNLPFIPVEDGTDTFFMQMPSSWGQVWTWDWWQDFRKWLAEHEEVQALEKLSPFVRSWPPSSWLKHKIRYLTDQGCFYVYPRQSLASNFGDSGTNFADNSTLYQVPLLLGPKKWQFGRLADSFAVYDAFFEWHGSNLAKFFPELQGARVECNLYGRKVLDQYADEDLFVTLYPAAKSEMSFGLEMRPAEQNLMQRIDGDKIKLAAKRYLDQPNGSEELLYRFFYQQIPLSRAVSLAKKQFQHKWDYYVRRRL